MQEVTWYIKLLSVGKSYLSKKYIFMETIFQLGIYSIKLKNSRKYLLLPGGPLVSVHDMGFQTIF